MVTNRLTKYPLAAPPAVGVENLKRLRLNTEAEAGDVLEEAQPLAGLMVSVHAPLWDGDVRLNIGAKDDEFRDMSIGKILAYIDTARHFPELKKVNMHLGPKQWLDEAQERGRTGDYGLMVDSIRRIADHAEGLGLEIVLENNSVVFAGVGDGVSPDEIDWSSRNQSFGTSPEEWIQICRDVDRPNVGLCLDSSHTCTYAHSIADPGRREEAVMGFLAKPDLIRHVHWNDNYLHDPRGRVDSHALIGKGSLPKEMHRAIKALDATLLLEHFYTIEGLEEELEYIAQL
ncbi:MAG: sugar phosphate isomerase/epimerase family protein [SAR202 cluster bacterium]|nr:sugar phosphate isomerase/epimerase family protein [SAR202 cluster bacterium]